MVALKVAVIGGGPAAMFFCHAYKTQEKRHQENGIGSFRELEITCFEMKSSPGGIWRQSGEKDSYEDLWTNGCCYALEFYDHTFQEHFQGKSLPVYLPRKDINEYITERVTKASPSLFIENFQFNTKVVHVEEASQTGESNHATFRVTTQDMQTGKLTETNFDKCIWASGENAKGSIPSQLRRLFEGESGMLTPLNVDNSASHDLDKKSNKTTKISDCDFCLVHSTETQKIRENVQDQRVLLIGGGFSAEDLALQCVKWGAAHVDIAARSDEAEVTWTSRWPGHDLVELHANMAVKDVDKQKKRIILQNVEFNWPNHYNFLEKESRKVLENINLVIFCTGYEANLTMLDERIRPACGRIPAWFMGSGETTTMNEFDWESLEFQMPANNEAEDYVGDITLATRRMCRGNYNHPDMHRGISFRNPNLIFLCEHGSDFPLLSLDAHAWLACSYLTGRISMPSKNELIEANKQQVLDQMKLPYLRYFMDEGYANALNESEPINDDDSGYWEVGYWKAQEHYTKYMVRLLAKVMEEGKYPGISLGTYEKLNENGQALIDFGMSSYYMRNDLKDYEDGHEWRTFRDDVIEPEYMYSLYTKNKARPLKQRWMDMNGSGTNGVGLSIKTEDI